MKHRLCLLWFFIGMAVLTGCRKAADFYQQVNAVPELYVSAEYSYKSIYAIGDTMTFYGRLNPQNGLTIQIGDAQAAIVQTGTVTVQISGSQGFGNNAYPIDQVKVLISSAMGTGLNRPVTITSGGNSIQGPAIEIYSPAAKGYQTDSLKLVSYYTSPAGAVFLNCVNGKGSLYYYANSAIVQIKKEAADNTVLAVGDFKDAYGAFTISTFSCGAVDAREQNLYFSALTTDATTNSSTLIYRLCKYDLVSKQLTTLNRSLFPKAQNQWQLTSYQPFEGALDTVKIAHVDALYADSSGGVYLQNDYALCHVQPTGTVRYLYKFSTPSVWNSTTGNLVSADGQSVPGFNFPSSNVGFNNPVISPDAGLLYTYRVGNSSAQSPTNINAYDLVNLLPLYDFQAAANSSTQIAGPFSSLPGAGNPNDLFGFMPLPGDRLLLLYQFQAIPFKEWGVLDFTGSRGDVYAPGQFDAGNFTLKSGTDLLLNYDEEGQLYMTANNKAILVKTTPQ